MEFRILGGLEVLRDGKPVLLRGRNLPKLLALLLLNYGTVVSLPQVVDCLWENDPPATARRQVQNTIAALRKILRDQDNRVIATFGDGYRLSGSRIEADWQRFTTAVDRSRRLAEAGDDVEALDAVTEGLRLWRGEALAGLSGAFMEAEARRLNEARLSAIETRIGLELRLGRGNPIGELRHLLTRHPYRQHVAVLLMLALYRQGRAAEALSVFTEVSSRLAEELGIDPGPALRERYTAILRQDPSLDVAPAGTQTAETASAAAEGPGGQAPIPAQLPASIAGFVGRRSQLETLDRLLAEGGRTAVLSTVAGTGGAGKTALSVHWAQQNRHKFPDGQLYINLRGFDEAEPVDARDALVRFLRALGVPGNEVPSDVDSASELYRSLLADKKSLILLDNARDEGQVRPLLPGGSGNLTIVTSRNRLTGMTALHDAIPINVDVLSRPESLEVLANLIGAERLHAEPQAAHDLAELCADLPLALRIAAANLADQVHLSVAEYVRQLQSPGRLDLLSIDGDPHAAVGAAFDLSYRALTPDAQVLFVQLGLFPGEDFHEDLAAAIAELPGSESRRLLTLLVSSHLLEQHQAKRYRFHDLLREYARRCADTALSEPDRHAVADRAISWYFERRANPVPEEYANIAAAHRAWMEHPDSWQLSRSLVQYLMVAYNLDDIRSHVEQAIKHAGHQSSPQAKAQLYDAMGQLRLRTGDMDGALASSRQVIDIIRDSPEADADGRLRTQTAGTYLGIGDFQQTIGLLSESLPIADALHDHRHQIFGHGVLGNTLCVVGRYARGLEELRRAGQVADESASETPYFLDSRFNLARRCAEVGLLEEAWENIGEIQAWWSRHNPDYNKVPVLWLCGNLHRIGGEHDDADHVLATVLELADRSMNQLWTCEVRTTWIRSLCVRGEYDKASRLLDEIAALPQQPEAPDDRAAIAIAGSMIHSGLGQHLKAATFGRQACEISSQLGKPLRQAESLLALATAYTGLGEFELARQRQDLATDIFSGLDLPQGARLDQYLTTSTADDG